MQEHQDIDRRSLALAAAVANKIDRDVKLLDGVKDWLTHHPSPAHHEWSEILTQPWSRVRATLLQDNHEGQRLRQSSPFVGILTPQERWAFYSVDPK